MRPTLIRRIEELAASIVNERVPMREAKQAFRAALFEAALQRHPKNVSNAARRLGIHRNTLHGELRRQSHR